MPLSKEERHALAVRVRLGEKYEITNEQGWVGYSAGHSAAPWRTPAGNGFVDVLGVRIARAGPHSEWWEWEDGTAFHRYEYTNQSLSRAILEYLERD